MIQEMQRDKTRFTPAKGFNVVGVDDFEAPGEQLYLIAHKDTEPEAEALLKAWQDKNPGETAHVYGPDTR